MGLIGVLSCWLAFQLLAIVWGIKEAILYSRLGAEAFTWNEHHVFSIERIFAYLLFVAGFVVGALVLSGRWWFLAAMGLSSLLSFPFFHDEAYNATRFRIDKKKYVYGYQSSTSTALIDLPKLPRLLCLIAGFIILLVYVYV